MEELELATIEHVGSTLLTEEHQAKWQRRHQLLSADHVLAGLFQGWKPEGFDHEPHRVLYIGKATSNAFDGPECERQCFNGPSMFWAFARAIATKIGCSDANLKCIAWSNISKVSRPQVKADSTLLVGFEREAASTLEDEIRNTKPHVIVFVTQHFCDQVVCSVAEAIDGDHRWNKSENETIRSETSDIWWTCRRDGKYVLWMRHPQGSKPELRDYAATKIAMLCQTAASIAK